MIWACPHASLRTQAMRKGPGFALQSFCFVILNQLKCNKTKRISASILHATGKSPTVITSFQGICLPES